jgi:hypothetical protein
MADRCTLHKDKLEGFKKWLNDSGIAHRPGKGDYQVLQVLTPKSGWQVIFKRNDMPEHFSINDKLLPVVQSYLSEKRSHRKIKCFDGEPCDDPAGDCNNCKWMKSQSIEMSADVN